MTQRKIQSVTIKLIEDGIGHPIKEAVFLNQIIRFTQGELITSMGVDGHMSVAGTPHCIEWVGGKKEDLQQVTRIEVSNENGQMIVSGDRNTNRVARALDDAVQFWVNSAA